MKNNNRRNTEDLVLFQEESLVTSHIGDLLVEPNTRPGFSMKHEITFTIPCLPNLRPGARLSLRSGATGEVVARFVLLEASLKLAKGQEFTRIVGLGEIMDGP